MVCYASFVSLHFVALVCLQKIVYFVSHILLQYAICSMSANRKYYYSKCKLLTAMTYPCLLVVQSGFLIQQIMLKFSYPIVLWWLSWDHVCNWFIRQSKDRGINGCPWWVLAIPLAIITLEVSFKKLSDFISSPALSSWWSMRCLAIPLVL